MMDYTEVQDPQDPPPPPGFTPVDQQQPPQQQAPQQQQQQDPPPPPGFTPVEQQGLTPAYREYPWLAGGVDLVHGAATGVASTLHGLDELGTKAWSKLSGTPQQPNIIPEEWTKAPPSLAGKIGHYGEQLGEFFLPGGAVSEGNKAIEAARIAPWMKLGAKATLEAIPAYGITMAQTGGDTAAAKEAAALAGGTTLALPLIGKVLTRAYGKITGAGYESIERAAEQPTPELIAAMRGEISEKDILEATRQAVDNVAQSRSADYTAQLAKIDPRIRVQLNPTRRAFSKLLDQFQVGKLYDPRTGQYTLDFQTKNASGLWADKPAQARIKELWDKMYSATAQDPRSVDGLKRGVDSMYRESGADRAIMQGVKDTLRDTLNKQVPGYQQMTEGYAQASDFLDNLKDLSTHATNDGTAIRKLAGALNQNNGYRSALLEELAQYTPKDIKGQMAGNRLSAWEPRGIVGAMHAAAPNVTGGAGAAGAFYLAAHNPAALAASLIGLFGLSPRVVGEAAIRARLAARFGKTAAGAAPSMLRITGEQPNYDQNFAGGQAKGGRVRYDSGDLVDSDGSDDLTPQELQRRAMMDPTFAFQAAAPRPQPRPKPARPAMGPPQAPPTYTVPPDETSYSQAMSQANPLPEWAQRGAAAVNEPFSMPIKGGPPVDPREVLDTQLRATGNIGTGLARMTSTPDTREMVGGANQAFSGLMEGATPFMMAAGITSPAALARTVLTLGGAGAVQNVVESEMEKHGYAPEYQQAAGNLAGLIAGSAVHGALPKSESLGEWMPTRAGLEQAQSSARESLQSKNAFEPGMTMYSNPLSNTADAAKLIGANIGLGVSDVAGLAAAKARQVRSRITNAAGQRVRGSLDESGKYIPAPADAEKMAPRIYEKLSGRRPMDVAETPRLQDQTEAYRARAENAAEKQLAWQNWDRPAAEKAYGTLTPSKAADPKPMKLRNTPDVVERRVQNARDFLAQPTEPWVAPDYGIFDRSLIKDAMEGFPDVEQTQHPRVVATDRADLSHVAETYNNPAAIDLIKKQIKRGLPLGGETFYASLYPLKVEAQAAGMSGAEFDNWVASVATASARNSIFMENAVGNFLRDLHHRGIPLTQENVVREMAAFKGRYGQGLPLMPLHRQGAANVLEKGIMPQDVLRENPTGTNYKIPTYAVSKSGDFKNYWVGDVHEAKGETLASPYHPYFAESGGFTPNEYGPAEGHMRGIAQEMGVPTGSAQAGRWIGGGPLTGLKSEGGDALDMLERQAAYTMHEQGLPTDPVSVRKYILNLVKRGGLMAPWYTTDPLPEFRQMAPASRKSR